MIFLPELISEFERDILSVVIFLIQFSFEFLINTFILFTRRQERTNAADRESSKES